MTTLPRNDRSAMNLVFLLLLGATVALTTGCNSKGEARPQDVAHEFLVDLRFREQEAVFDAIWPPRREILKETYQELADGIEGELTLGLEDMVSATRVHSVFLVHRAEVDGAMPESPAHGEQVVVRLEYRDSREASIPMRWGDGRWYVDLPISEARPLDLPGREEGAADGMDDEDARNLDTLDDEISDDE